MRWGVILDWEGCTKDRGVVSRRYTETSIIAYRKRRYMGSLGGALESAEGPAAQGYPAQWREEQIASCGAWDATLYSEW